MMTEKELKESLQKILTEIPEGKRMYHQYPFFRALIEYYIRGSINKEVMIFELCKLNIRFMEALIKATELNYVHKIMLDQQNDS